MKVKILLILSVLGFTALGCGMDIPSSEIGGLDKKDFCVLSGGVYKNSEIVKDENRCFCGDEECSENVTCRFLETNNSYQCGGLGITLLPSGPCMMEGVQVCGERIDAAGRSMGYETKCENHQWTAEKACGNSCQYYQFGAVTSSRCGECISDGITCIGGNLQ